MYNGLKKRKTFEELIEDLQNFDKLIKYPNRKATRIKEWIDMLNMNISSPINFVDDHIGKLFDDKAVQTDFIELKDKSTQTDINEKGTQVDITPQPLKYTKLLDSYAGPDVVDDSGWFSFKKKKKATQTLRAGHMQYPPTNYDPPSPPYTPSEPNGGRNAQPLDLPDLMNPLINMFFAPLNFGLGLLNNSPAETVNSSPPISVHSSPPVSVASSSTSKITTPPISVASSPPISVASSHHHVISPSSPSYLPLDSEPNTPASSRRSRRSR